MDFKLGTQSFTEKQIVDATHPAVMQAMKVKADQGDLALGLLIAKNGNGDVVPYDPAGLPPLNVVVGVLTIKVDTTKETVGVVLRHGTVVKDSLLTGASASSADDIVKLEAIGIFAI
ncbi:MAG: head decoration protein [Nitrospirae bacterium]|nr:head decoration protein [Nitrospirota bacterium]